MKEEQKPKDDLTERLDKAFIKAGLTPNWTDDKAGTCFVTVSTGIKIKTNKDKK